MADKKIDPELLSFGAEMKEQRLRAGLNQAELARLVNVTRSYIGQVERGDTRCRLDFTERLDKALQCGKTLADAWEELLRASKYPKYFVNFPKAEGTATQLRAYEAYFVYGFFQKEDYARALLADEEAVDTRMSRQSLLTRDPLPMVSVVMEESVLYRQVGTAKTMREQLDFLIEASHRDKVNIQIAPFAHYKGVRGSFHIATQPNRSEVVYVEKATGGETSTDPADLTYVNELMVTLQAQALNVTDTRTLLRKVMTERWT
ncbi:helix-turn-helix domain-containing protein [Spirillospora sp. NBC_01491]|uniref:helix-turn-helix domain-containing protein n=1 Tax=Spirillospora sp. NBC_01491 TaxID=2976007 RepID=UPI002E2F8289|nr:helix-turn-helix transcriptional regulator [Spirillospora sp. NBC_01491]